MSFNSGSGTLLEALGAEKKVIVVVNENLMDNHQVELARQLGNMGCLVYSNPRYEKAAWYFRMEATHCDWPV